MLDLITTPRPVVLALDWHYMDAFKVAVGSMMTHLRGSPPSLIILYESQTLSNQHRAAAATFLDQFSLAFEFRAVDNLLPSNLPIREGQHVTRATFYRLFLTEILPSNIPSALYLDLDILVLADIQYLLEMRLTSPIAAADQCNLRHQFQFHGIIGGAYFNAGIMVANLDTWRKTCATSTFLKILKEERDRLVFWDQDVLNIAFQNEWQRIPITFNLTNSALLVQQKFFPFFAPCIIHFDGADKPWHAHSYHPYKSSWRAAYRKLCRQPFDDKGSFRNKLGALRRRLFHAYKKNIHSL
jgi:lipopolysaccharide biosynthesis glycosyltransferase